MKFETKNEFSRGSIAGAISAVVICLFVEVFEWLKIAKHCWLFIAGQAVMHFNHDLWQGSFALLLHLGIGSLWGVVIAFMLKMVKAEKYLVKGAVIGLAIFFLHFGLLAKGLHYPEPMREDPMTLFIIFTSYLIYGALTAWLIDKLPGKADKV